MFRFTYDLTENTYHIPDVCSHIYEINHWSVRWELLDLNLWPDLVDSLNLRSFVCSCVCSLSRQNCEAHRFHICLVREIYLLISAKNFKLSNVKDPSLSFQFLHKSSLLIWAIKILSCKNQMKILNNLHIRMISKKIVIPSSQSYNPWGYFHG